MFFNFLINCLHLADDNVAYIYADWYEGTGAIIGAIVPLLSSLAFVLLFYYVWSRVKATTTLHWLLMGGLNMLVSFALNLFIGKAFLSNYLNDMYTATNETDYYNMYLTVSSWPYTTDLWIFAVNGIIWSAVFYFVLSVILKTWSPVYNIPFGKKHKKSNN